MFAKRSLALITLLFNFPLFAEQKIVTVATLGNYAPLLFSADNQAIRATLKPGEDTPNFYGYSWDVFRDSFHIMGYTIKLKVKPWARALKEFEAGGVDLLFPAGKNKKRLLAFNYAEKSINEAHFVVYVRKDAPIIWNGLSSLKGLNIGAIRGFNYGNKWEDITDIRKVNVKHILTGFEMLAKDRLDGFVGYELNWDYQLNEKGWSHKFHKLAHFDYSREYVVALKDNKKGQTLLDDFDTGKQKLIETGRLQEIKLKWSLSK